MIFYKHWRKKVPKHGRFLLDIASKMCYQFQVFSVIKYLVTQFTNKNKI